MQGQTTTMLSWLTCYLVLFSVVGACLCLDVCVCARAIPAHAIPHVSELLCQVCTHSKPLRGRERLLCTKKHRNRHDVPYARMFIPD